VAAAAPGASREPRRIRRLPDHLVNKIAAGEVVGARLGGEGAGGERLDALCTQVTVDLRDAGRALIRVTDDGIGMSSEEVDLALLRHATSKLATDADLDAITTLGFRGEALPAICAVTRFSVLSCPRGADTGTLVRGEGGTISEKLLVPAPAGTTVEAQDLFFNTPARLKFMKSAQSEVAAAFRLLEATALAHQDVHFRVSHNGRPALGAPRARTLRDRVGALWGFERAGKLVDVLRKDGPLAVSGLIGPPQLARGNRDEIVLIVNGRPVRDTQLSQTLIEAYRPLLACDQFPVAVLHSSCRPRKSTSTSTDQGLGPLPLPRQIQEILYRARAGRLRRRQVEVPALAGMAPAADCVGQYARLGVQGAISEARHALDGRPDPTLPRGPGALLDGQLRRRDRAAAGHVRRGRQRRRGLLRGSARGPRARAVRAAAPRSGRRGPAALAGAALPAARRAGWGPGRSGSRWARTLEDLGFGLEGWSGSTVVLRAVPALLKGQDARRLIEALVEDVNRPRKGEPVPLLHRALSFVACHAAIKAHAPLQREEMTRLLADLAATRTPYFCPHGRPIVSRLSLRDIKRELGRTW
jgi:DNA mismatch repair protein MutL